MSTDGSVGAVRPDVIFYVKLRPWAHWRLRPFFVALTLSRPDRGRQKAVRFQWIWQTTRDRFEEKALVLSGAVG